MEILNTINTVTLFSLDITSKNMKKVKFNAKGCCNPFNEHSRVKFTNIRNVNESLVDKAIFLRIVLSTGQKICQACAIKINRNYETRKNQSHRPRSDAYNLRTETATTANLMESSDSETDQINPFPEYTGVDVPKIKSKLNELLPLLGMAKLDESKLRSDVYKKDVLNNVIDALSKHIFKGATVNKDSIEIIDQLKTKFNEFESYQDKLKLLSVLPKSWTAFQIQKEFNTSYYFATKSKVIVAQHGILCNMSKRIGSTKLNEETLKIVQDFYRSDDVSRACAGKREYVRYNENMEKVTIQRRLVLMNLNEAYQLFKTENPNEKIGFSKFAAIRPPECTLALETYGTHTTCVCSYHQNVKLITESLQRNGFSPDVKNFQHWLNIMLCENKTFKCHTNECSTCPGKPAVETYLHEQLQLQMIEQISFKQWINDGGKFHIFIQLKKSS